MFLFIIIIILLTGALFCVAPDGLRPTRLLRSLTVSSNRVNERVRGLGRELKSAGKREQAAREIFSALSVLRNQASASAGAGAAAVTTDVLLEQFAGSDGVLKRAYQGTLRLLRTGRSADAIDFFTKAAGVGLARDFIMLVMEWDEIAPERLLGTIAAFRNAMKETRTTELMRKNEVLSDIVYLPVVVGVLVVFVNFIYVAYFAEQREMLTELFY